MSKITFEEYKKEIKKKYAIKKGEDVSGILLNPTPAQLRNLCLMTFDNGLSANDKNVFTVFFNGKEEEALRKAIENFDIGKLKPVISFLKGEKDSEHVSRIELAAILVEFNSRPYSKYLQSAKTQLKDNTKDVLAEKKDFVVEDNFLSKQVVAEVALPIYKVISTKKIGIAFIALLFVFFMGYTAKGMFFKKYECMQWNNDHYEAVDCSNDQMGIGQINTVFPLDESILTLKKIEPSSEISFFKNDKPIVWYSKKDGVISLFNGPGFHPETGKPLKPVTKYIIEKYNLQR